MVDTAKLTGERLEEFETDKAESNRRYDHAFSVVLSHTSTMELQEFWRLFTIGSRTSMNIDLGAGTRLSDADMQGGSPGRAVLERRQFEFAPENPMFEHSLTNITRTRSHHGQQQTLNADVNLGKTTGGDSETSNPMFMEGREEGGAVAAVATA